MRTAIIGGGIIGLYLAWKLGQRGEEVAVFEKKEKIGKAACSGLFSQRILEFIPESKNLIQNRIDSVLICFPGKTLKIKFSRKFVVMSHYELDNLVANLATRAGAEILLNSGVTDSGLVELKKKFDRIIGCDGADSFVRKSLGLPDPKFRLAIQGFISEKNTAVQVETWPTQKGFLWKIPRGREVEYGIIEKPAMARKLFEEFLKTNALGPDKIVSALVPQGLIIPKNPNITLCGDSAGLCKPWSGGGVVWGLIAANLLLKNFPDFVKYKNEARQFFLPKVIFSAIATKTAYFLGFKAPWLLPKNFKIEGDFLI